MEKSTPHCTLADAQDLARAGKIRITKSAVIGAAALGLGPAAIVETLMSLDRRSFRKSMTTYADHRVWQDVYCAMTEAGMVYLKLTVVDDVLVVSFKEC
ncbi:type II toxin-antitoxin system MqsR family toxin [Paraburkholderia caffeinilytica]|uniref:type II toxin-antitoxin system MqsR family toxin n=1 Tax=Paraburkholderia caffeinilytica TaxID=1761016 RepID=UPI003DA00F18